MNSPSIYSPEGIIRIIPANVLAALCGRDFDMHGEGGHMFFIPEELKIRIAKLIGQDRIKLEELLASAEGWKITRPGDRLQAFNLANAPSKQEVSLRVLLELLGGDTRERILQTYKLFNFDGYRLREKFDEKDKVVILGQMKELAGEKGGSIGQLKVLDVATGDGRMIEMMIGLVEEEDKEHLKEFKRNVRGVELVPEVIEQAREKLEKRGIPREHIFEGDFGNLPKELMQGEFDMVTCGMHSSWHNTTENQWISFWSNISKALLPGGRAIADTTPTDKLGKCASVNPDIVKPEEFLGDKKKELIEEVFYDLRTLYEILCHHYCEQHNPTIRAIAQKMGIQEEDMPNLFDSPRHFVSDSGPGIERYGVTREILNSNYVLNLCKAHGIPFEYGDLIRSKINVADTGDDEDKIIILGGNLLTRAEIKMHVHAQIIERIFGNTTPGAREAIQYYKAGGRKKIKKEGPGAKLIEEHQGILKEVYYSIARAIVNNYGNNYLILKKSKPQGELIVEKSQ